MSNEQYQTVPVVSGGIGFIPFVVGGHETLVSIISPVLLAPIGEHWLIESRAAFEGDFTHDARNHFGSKINKDLEYLQLDYIASPYITVTVGRFLAPFGIYRERVYPVWIRNLQADPLILPIGTDSSNGVMLRGGIMAGNNVDVLYTAYFSTLSAIHKLESNRQAGGRFGLFFPKQRLELGASLQHLLQADRSNRYGFHFVWQPQPLPLDIRAEYANSAGGHGYWIEPAYRLSQVPFGQPFFSKLQAVARLQQFFLKRKGDQSLPTASTQEIEYGMNYNFTDGLRATGSFGRQFSSAADQNVWTIGMSYRFAFPLGRGSNP